MNPIVRVKVIGARRDFQRFAHGAHHQGVDVGGKFGDGFLVQKKRQQAAYRGKNLNPNGIFVVANQFNVAR
jgi:hypothetical protein